MDQTERLFIESRARFGRFVQDYATLLRRYDSFYNPVSVNLAMSAGVESLEAAMDQIEADANAGTDTRQPLPPLHPNSSTTTTARSRQHPSSTTTTTASTAAAPSPNAATPPRRRPAFGAGLSSVWRSSLWSTTDDDGVLSLPDPITSQRGEANFDDPYLAALADGEFSSPSSYPSFTDPAIHAITQRSNRGQHHPHTTPQPSRPQPPSARHPSTATAPRDPSGACILNLDFTAPQRSTTQLSSSTTAGESQSTLHTLDSFDDSDLFESPASSFSDSMPRTSRPSRAAAPNQHTVHDSKRRRTSVTGSQPKAPSPRTKHRPPSSKDVDDSLFGSSPPKATPAAEPHSDDLATIDLTEATEVPEELKKPVEDKRIKLSAFQCVICMDDVTNLTVTHCGHLYCAQCLHSSLNVEATRGKCPMCRQKLDMKSRESYNGKTKGYWPLELKLMTATRKGKRKADTLS